MGRKHRRPDPEDTIPDVLPLPPVSESATDYEPVEPEIVAAPDIVVATPDAPAAVGEREGVSPKVPQPDALPVVIPPITRADRISAGKLIARKLGIAPAAAQEQSARLSDDQVRAVLSLQLAEDPRERLRQILA